MKTAWTITMMAAMAMTANAKVGAPVTNRTITIYMIDHRNDSGYPLNLAEKYASRIFGSAKLDVEWRSGKPAETPSPNGMTFVVEVTDHTSVGYHQGALAFALPYEGVHIMLLFDRIQRLDKQAPDALLAHVLTHEITHMLEGISRHSQTGVMKANYTSSDIWKMRSHPLTFADEDLMLIDLGLARRHQMQLAATAETAADEETR